MTHAVRNMAMAMGRSALPNEACGLVSGLHLPLWDDESTVRVTRILRVHNTAASPARFALDGQAMMDAEARIRDVGEEVIGVVHSHPVSPAVPSATDLADARLYDPESIWLQLIVSMQGFAPNIRAWRFPAATDESGVVPVELVIHLRDTDLRSS